MSTQEQYERLRDEKRCVRCWQQDERTLKGLSTCEKCSRKLSEYRKEFMSRPGKKEERRIKYKSFRKKRYYKWRENHQCAHCGSALPENYYFIDCPKCRQYQEEYRKRKKTAGAATPNGQKKIS